MIAGPAIINRPGDAIKKQSVQVNIKIERTAKSLDERNDTSMRCDFGVTVFVAVYAKNAIDDTRPIFHNSVRRNAQNELAWFYTDEHSG